MSDAPRYRTLRDYLRVLRGHRLLIVLTMVVFAACAFAISSQREPIYEAEAALSFQDPTVDLDLIGGAPGAPRRTPEQRSAVSAELVTRPEIAQRVADALRTDAEPNVLRGAVDAQPETRTNLVVIQARWTDPDFAARLANEFGRQIETVVTRDERRRFADAAASLRRRFREVERGRRGRDSLATVLREERVARLESLRDLARPVEITRLAEPPSAAISPKTTRDTILAAILGLTLGILAAFIRDSLDVRLREPGDIQTAMALPILGQVSSRLLGSAGPRTTGRRAPSDADLEGFRILRRAVDSLGGEETPHTIAVTSAESGEGKSTTAAALAWASAVAGRRTALIECDLRRPALAERLGIPASPGLLDNLNGAAALAEILRPVPVERASADPLRASLNGKPSPAGMLTCIAAGTRTAAPAEALESAAFKGLLENMQRQHDVVILDTSPVLAVVDTLELLPAADAVVVCVRAGRTTREAAAGLRAALAQFRDLPMGLVITAVRPGDGPRYPAYGQPPRVEPPAAAPMTAP